MSLEQEMEKRGLNKDYVLVDAKNPVESRLDSALDVDYIHLHILKKLKPRLRVPQIKTALPHKLKTSALYLINSIERLFTRYKKVVDIELFHGFIRKFEISDPNFDFIKQETITK